MLRPVTPLLLVVVLLSGCEKLLETAIKSTGSGAQKSPSQVQVASSSGKPLSPEVATAFTEIWAATQAHNLVLIEKFDKNQPANGAAYSAGINRLHQAGRRHGGLTKGIIDSVVAAWIYEKGIFVVFDTMDRQIAGMKTRGDTIANQRRGYIQIVDSGINAYDRGIGHLERWEEPLLLKQFAKRNVPREIGEEFLRLRNLGGGEVMELEKEMLRERKAALQVYRTAFTQPDQSRWNQYVAEANRHDQKAAQLQGQVIAEIRKRLQAARVL